MILEAFSAHLKKHFKAGCPPERILMQWLTGMLLIPAAPDDMVAKVLHAEISLFECNGHHYFEGNSPTGRLLLKSLTQYCRSYDHWQFSRWVHEVQASDFKPKYGS